MNDLLGIVAFIPSLFILFVIGKSIRDLFQQNHYYFVSYHWDSKRQTGSGSIEITLHEEIESYDDIKEIKTHIEDMTKDVDGNPVVVVINNFIKLSKPGKHIRSEHIYFTEEGVHVQTFKDRSNEEVK